MGLISDNAVQADLWAQPAICKRIGTDEVFAQHVYAAFCNQKFIRVDGSAPETEPWACSWRKAAEIIATIRNEFYNKTENPDIIETYTHWYCSGMGCLEGSVNEGVVTKEVRNMFRDMGWELIAFPNEWGI